MPIYLFWSRLRLWLWLALRSVWRNCLIRQLRDLASDDRLLLSQQGCNVRLGSPKKIKQETEMKKGSIVSTKREFVSGYDVRPGSLSWPEALFSTAKSSKQRCGQDRTAWASVRDTGPTSATALI